MDFLSFMIGVPLIAAPTEEDADYLASSTYQRIFGMLTGRRGRLQPPVKGFLAQLHAREREAIADFLSAAVIGTPETVREGFTQLARATQADEFMQRRRLTAYLRVACTHTNQICQWQERRTLGLYAIKI